MAAPTMNDPSQAQEGSPAEEGAESPQEEQGEAQDGKSDDPSKLILGMQQTLTGMVKALQGSIPKEAEAALKNAAMEYNKFASLLGAAHGVKGMPQPGQAPQGAMQSAQAGPGSMPADMPMRPGAVPVHG